MFYIYTYTPSISVYKYKTFFTLFFCSGVRVDEYMGEKQNPLINRNEKLFTRKTTRFLNNLME